MPGLRALAFDETEGGVMVTWKQLGYIALGIVIACAMGFGALYGCACMYSPTGQCP